MPPLPVPTLEPRSREAGAYLGLPHLEPKGQQAAAYAVKGSEDFFVALVVYHQQRRNLQWEPFLYNYLRELCRAAKEYGMESSYFKGFLKATLAANTLVPVGTKIIMTPLLTDTQFWVWEWAWHHLLKELLDTWGTKGWPSSP